MASEGMPGSLEEMQMKQQQDAANQERRNMILDQILEPSARERLSRLKMVRPDKARATEDALLTAASNGRIQKKIAEEDLIALLEQFGGSGGGPTAGAGKKSVVIQRRNYGMEEDGDDDDSDLM